MKKKPNKILMKNFRNKIIFTWLIATLLPIFVLIGYVVVMSGPRLLSLISNAEGLNSEIWQLQKWNSDEYVFRYINSVITDNPDALLLKETYKPIEDVQKIRKLEMIVIVRKGETLIPVNDFNTDDGVKIVNKLKNLNAPVLPKFGSYYYTQNEELFDKTGFTVYRQFDFYFNDGEQGSVFMLIKMINIPGTIGKFVANYFLVLFGIMLFLMMVFFTKATINLTRNFEHLAAVTDEVSKENFENRLNIVDEPLSFLSIQLNSMIDKLAEAKKYRTEIENNKNEFISNMTHDIKTPLTSIGVQIEALKDGIITNPEQISTYYNSIEKKLIEIDKMMDELQMFNELEMRIKPFDYEQVDIEYFFEDIIEEWRYNPSHQNVVFKLNTNLTHQSVLAIDPMKFKRVFSNLFNNSFKYSKADPLKIEISLNQINGFEDMILIQFKDNGVGVPTQELDQIFVQYHRVDPSRNQQVSGSGLGLAISKNIIERHGGTIRAYNEAPGGFVIEIKLPMKGVFNA